MAWIDNAYMQAYFGATALSGFAASQITTKISVAEGMIENYLDRTIDSATYIQWFNGSGTRWMVLPQYPITTIYRVTSNRQNGLKLQNTSADADEATAYIVDGSLILTVIGGTNDGTSSLTLSTYATLTLLKAAIDALATGWSVTVENEGVPAHIRPVGIGACLNTFDYFEIPEDSRDDVVIERDQATLYHPYGFMAGQQNIFAHYIAGYGTVDEVLKGVEAQLTFKLLNTDTADPNIRSEKLGDYSYTQESQRASPLDEFEESLAFYVKYRFPS